MCFASVMAVSVESLDNLSDISSLHAIKSTKEADREYYIRRDRCGRETFIKRLSGIHGITEYVNVEGELLASLLLTAAGLPSLKPKPIFVRQTQKWYVETQLIRLKDYPHMLVSSLAENPMILSEVDTTFLAKLCVLDILIGNADRSLGNLILRKTNGRTAIIPIDHHLAFVTPEMTNSDLSFSGFVNGYMGIECNPNDNGYRKWFCRRCGSLEHIISSTPIYYRFTPSGWDLDSVNALYHSTQHVIKLLSDDLINEATRALPDSIIMCDPTKRKEDIMNTLKNRRDNLLNALLEYLPFICNFT